MEPLRWLDHNTLELLDQTLLPGKVVFNTYRDYRPVVEDIKRLAVRGAPLIGVAAAYAYCLAALEFAGKPDYLANLDKAKDEIWASRPTAVNLFWALERMDKCCKGCGGDVGTLVREAEAIQTENIRINEDLSEAGAAIVPEGARILTHCNAGGLATDGMGTALGVVRAAHAQGKVAMVYTDETRPLLQGSRLSAYELHADGIPVTVIADNMAASLMRMGKIDLVILGCDRMAMNGDFANKIGTYSVAVNARHHGIPFYTALPTSSIDLELKDGSGIPIEQRSPDELRYVGDTQTAPLGTEVYNPAFDVTPHQLVTGIITEKGVIHPPFAEGLKRLFQK